MKSIHFISGLPRSGSTLLVAILRQNPRFHAAMSSPLAGILKGLLQSMSAANDLSMFISERQRHLILQSSVAAYYTDVPQPIVFDLNRHWCSVLPTLATVFPTCRVICCVRSPAWILDSVERFVQRNPFQSSRMFGYDCSGTVYDRVDALLKGHFLGLPLNGLKQAWFGEHANRLIAIRYDSLARQPNAVLDQLYGLLGEECVAHDFNNLDYSEPEFDDRLGMPGFHTVAPAVKANERQTILPPDIFEQYNKDFWNGSNENPRNVPVL